MQNLSHLQTRIFDTPLAILPSKLEVILSVIGSRIGLEVETRTDVDPSQEYLAFMAEFGPANNRNKPAYQVTQGVAIIPVDGTLMKKTSGLNALSGTASYEDVQNQIKGAIANSAVKGILLDVSSPGGETHGLFELCDYIYSLRGSKPIYAIANDGAYSAAYAIASAADKIFVTRTAGVGSVGVFTLHVDQSAADTKAGLKYTYIKAGQKKTDGNPHEALTDAAESDVQTEVDRQYQMFCALVARNRNVSVEKIAGTQAGVFFADNALPLLADEVGTLDDAIAGLTQDATGLNKNSHTFTMSKGKQNNMAQDTIELTISAKTVDEYDKDAAGAQDDADEACDMAADEQEESDDMHDAQDTIDKVKNPDEDEDDKSEPEATKVVSVSAFDMTRIVNLCTLAGHSELAASYLNAGATVAQVEKELLDKRTMKSKSTQVNTNIDNTVSNPIGAFDRLEHGATALAKEKGISKARAYQELCLANPKLYDDYEDERHTAGESRKATKSYIAAMTARMNNRGNY